MREDRWVDGLGVGDGLTWNAGEIAMQAGLLAGEERVGGAVGERRTTEPALLSEGVVR
jgi:hypothetical protein